MLVDCCSYMPENRYTESKIYASTLPEVASYLKEAFREEVFRNRSYRKQNTKEIKKMNDNYVKKVRVFESSATKDRIKKDGTKVEKYEITRITEVTFKDGDVERAYCTPPDEFDLDMGIIICIAKWACEGSKGLYKQIKEAKKIYQKPFDDAEKKKKEEEIEKRRYEKRYKEKQKRIERRMEKRIDEQKEAFIRAIKELTSKPSSDDDVDEESESDNESSSMDLNALQDYNSVEELFAELLKKTYDKSDDSDDDTPKEE